MEHETTAENIHPNVLTLMFWALSGSSPSQLVPNANKRRRGKLLNAITRCKTTHMVLHHVTPTKGVLRGRGTTNRP